MDLRYRYFTVAYGFMLMFMLNAYRANIAISILKMTKNSTYERLNETRQVAEYFDWSPEIQGHVLASGHLGYIFLQLPAGRLAEKYGSKIVMLSGLACSSLANVLSPYAARFDPIFLIVVQLIRGLGMGAITPAVSCLIASWFPKQERRFVYTFVFSGTTLGSFVGGTLSGFLCELSVLDGWPLAFYVFGAAGCLQVVLLSIFMYEDPEVHPSISESEMKFILDGRMKSRSSQKLPVPWMKILFSAPSLAVFYGSFGQYWMCFYFIGVHNLFLGNVVKFSISENGNLFAAGAVLRGTVMCIAGYGSDVLHRTKNIELNTIRKGNNTLSSVLNTVFLLVIYFVGYDKTVNVICCLAAMGLGGLGVPGSITAPVEMTPNFAGTLSGVSNTVSGLAAFLVALVAGYLTTKEQLLSEWRNVFLINIAVALSSAAVFQFFGSADVQPWNGPVDDIQTRDKKKTTADQENQEHETNIS